MPGIYIHIPFCKQACHYCNFHFSTSLKLKDEFLHALLNEIELQKNYLPKKNINTLYFGGGTPSLLLVNEVETIVNKVKQHFIFEPKIEITFEANPDDITIENLHAWKKIGINRLSLGVQSFIEQDLQWMNRAHSAQQAINSIELIKQSGFENYSLDLIYGTPTLSNDAWKKNLEFLFNINPPHVSCYALTVEPQTALHYLIKKGKKQSVQNDVQAQQFTMLMHEMKKHGYEHYEISNFAKPGWRSKHNSSYWSGENYLGIGPSAHSYNGVSRQWNIANNALYIQSLKNQHLNFDIEILSEIDKKNEFIMLSLRKREGLDLKQFSVSEQQKILEIAQSYFKQQKLIEKDGKLLLTDEGKLFADGIAADMFFNEE